MNERSKHVGAAFLRGTALWRALLSAVGAAVERLLGFVTGFGRR